MIWCFESDVTVEAISYKIDLSLVSNSNMYTFKNYLKYPVQDNLNSWYNFLDISILRKREKIARNG